MTCRQIFLHSTIPLVMSERTFFHVYKFPCYFHICSLHLTCLLKSAIFITGLIWLHSFLSSLMGIPVLLLLWGFMHSLIILLRILCISAFIYLTGKWVRRILFQGARKRGRMIPSKLRQKHRASGVPSPGSPLHHPLLSPKAAQTSFID